MNNPRRRPCRPERRRTRQENAFLPAGASKELRRHHSHQDEPTRLLRQSVELPSETIIIRSEARKPNFETSSNDPNKKRMFPNRSDADSAFEIWPHFDFVWPTLFRISCFLILFSFLGVLAPLREKSCLNQSLTSCRFPSAVSPIFRFPSRTASQSCPLRDNNA